MSKIHSKLNFNDLHISIEIPAGGYRSGISKDGIKWKNKIYSNYGYILGTNSPDGEHLDCWVRKNPKKNSNVYVIHQLSVDGTKYDEDKVMLGYSSIDEAITDFKKHSYKPETMFGGISEFPMEFFKVMAYQSSNSKTILGSEENINKLKEKNLIPKGISTPIETAKKVKENQLYHIRFNNNTLLENCEELLNEYDIDYFKTFNVVGFNTRNDLEKYIDIIDENYESNELLGNLADNISLEDNITNKEDDDVFFQQQIMEMKKLSGIKEEFRKPTNTIYDFKYKIENINSTFRQQLKNHYFKMAESINNFDFNKEKLFRMLISGIKQYPYSSSKILEAINRKYFPSLSKTLLENAITYDTGMSLEEFYLIVKESDKYDNNAHKWVNKRVDQLWPTHISDKSKAFGIAWNEYKEKKLHESSELFERIDIQKTIDNFGNKLKDRIKSDHSSNNRSIEQIIQAFINADPSSNQKYTLWMIRTYLNKGINYLEDLSRTNYALSLFDKFKNKLPIKDINQIKSLNQLEDLVDEFNSNNNELSNKDVIKEIKTKETEYWYRGSEGIILVPLTERSSCFWGKNTKWCTASTQSRNYFNEYNTKGKLFIIIDKKDNKKYQFHFETRQFMNAKDQEINIKSYLEKNQWIVKVLMPYITSNAKISYCHALYILRGPFPEGEPIISTNAEFSYWYVYWILKDRFPLGEKSMKQYPEIWGKYIDFLKEIGKYNAIS